MSLISLTLDTLIMQTSIGVLVPNGELEWELDQRYITETRNFWLLQFVDQVTHTMQRKQLAIQEV